MVEISRDLRRAPTRGESILWDAIRNRQLSGRKFRRQYVIGTFVVDFYCATERLIVEVDGPIHASQRSADQERQQILESLRYRVLRINDTRAQTDLEGTLGRISAAFTSQAPPLRRTERGLGGEVRTTNGTSSQPKV
jgi:adenine-specific DNA-methyltransferase